MSGRVSGDQRFMVLWRARLLSPHISAGTSTVRTTADSAAVAVQHQALPENQSSLFAAVCCAAAREAAAARKALSFSRGSSLACTSCSFISWMKRLGTP